MLFMEHGILFCLLTFRNFFLSTADKIRSLDHNQKCEMFLHASSNNGFGRSCINEIFQSRLHFISIDEIPAIDIDLIKYAKTSGVTMFYDDFVPGKGMSNICSVVKVQLIFQTKKRQEANILGCFHTPMTWIKDFCLLILVNIKCKK